MKSKRKRKQYDKRDKDWQADMLARSVEDAEKVYRPDMPAIPDRIKSLPVERGYPVPWFVSFVDGHYDFRVADSRKLAAAINEKLCWICGQKLGASLAFVIGPMCSVNRITSEPACHRECAEFAAVACPFVNQSQTKRNKNNLPDGVVDPAGCHIERQPGAMCLWITKTYTIKRVDNGILFNLGEPEQVFWYREGRHATRDEVLESIESGLPQLREMAAQEGTLSVRRLEEAITRSRRLLPSDTPKKNLFGSAAVR